MFKFAVIMSLDKLHRKLLAACIHVGKEPTKENILKYALKCYLTECYNKCGLCHAINDAIIVKLGVNWIKAIDIKILNFKLFNIDTAKNFDTNIIGLYWWPIEDWKSRYKYMKWLIKQYK